MAEGTTTSTTKKPWADGPHKLISTSRARVKAGEKPKGAQAIAAEMITVHNVLLRTLNSVYLQCVNVGVSGTKEDVADFVSYAATWAAVVEEHHETEETMLFPEMERMAGVEGLMAANVAQHTAFHDGLVRYQEYLKAVQAGEEEYNGEKLRGIIDDFGTVLQEHLNDEIDTLMGLEAYEDKADWGVWFQKKMEEILAKVTDPRLKTDAFPQVITNHDGTFEGGIQGTWPPMPWFARLIFRWFYIPTRKSWWRFSSCDDHGNPKELPFA